MTCRPAHPCRSNWPRQTNGYIDATEPFKLAKDSAKAERLSTVLNLAAQAITKTLVALIPILPERAIEGLRQLNVEVTASHSTN